MTIQGLQVLIVDDSAMNRKLISMLLTRMGAVAREASGGAECVEMLDQKKYDVILMDHMMPEMDGVETLGKIRSMDGPIGETPVVALTADDEGHGEDYYMQMGFDGYLVKPVLPQKLAELLENL